MAWMRHGMGHHIVKMSETDLQRTIIDACKIYGFKVSHFRPAKTERGWRTPVQGDAASRTSRSRGTGTCSWPS
jgi:hypothetical protein